MGYDFSSLSPSDFEDLSRDLLQAELGVRLESFTTGRDHGVDLRHTRQTGTSLIIQCKHYARSGFRLLRSSLLTDLPKVRKLGPERYIVTTTVGLTPQNKDLLLADLAPYLQSTSDIFGADDVNNLLARFPKVEQGHFKLWLGSSTVLERLLNSSLYSRTQSIVHDIEQRVRLYVTNPSFNRAFDVLETHHVCIIAGQPGIGKTMLAQMLMLHHIRQGYEPIAISADVEEAERLYSPSVRQFFYYDDFLGTSFDDTLVKNEDARLTDFLQRIAKGPNKRLVLTTREYILRRAKSRYERLETALGHALQCVIELEDYTRLLRARILYNHIFFSDLPIATIAAFCEQRLYRPILVHDNFSPRLIEFAIRHSSAERLSSQALSSYLKEILDYPDRLWNNAFTQQLHCGAQAILLAMLFLPRPALWTDLAIAAQCLAVGRNQFRMNGLELSNYMRTLEGTFTAIEAHPQGQRGVQFASPAIGDYLLRLVDGDATEIRCIVDSFVYFEQVTNFWSASQSRGSDNKPRYPGIRRWQSENEPLLLAAIVRTFDGPSCVWHESLSKLRRLELTAAVNTEKRCVDTLEISDSLGHGEVRRWVEDRAKTIPAEWARRKGSRLDAAKLASMMSLEDEVADDLKQWSLEDLDQARDFDAALELLDNENLCDDEYSLRVLQEFGQFAHDEYRRIMQDCDEASDVESRFEEADGLASRLGIDLPWDSGIVQEKIDSLRAYEDDFDSDAARRAHGGGGRNARSISLSEDARIDSLFDSLATASREDETDG